MIRFSKNTILSLIILCFFILKSNLVIANINTNNLSVSQSIVKINEIQEEISKLEMPDKRELILKAFHLDQKARYLREKLRIQFKHPDRSHFDNESDKIISKIDEISTLIVKDYLELNDWPTIDKFGAEFPRAVFLLVQHSEDLNLQKKVLTYFEKFLDGNYIHKDNYALLYDRVSMLEGRKQKYGTQYTISNESNCLELYDVENYNELNYLRKEFNLNDIESYACQLSSMYNTSLCDKSIVCSVNRIAKPH